MSVNILCSMDLKIGRTVAPWLLRVLLGQRNKRRSGTPSDLFEDRFIGYLYPGRDRISKSYPARLTFYVASGRTVREILDHYGTQNAPHS